MAKALTKEGMQQIILVSGQVHCEAGPAFRDAVLSAGFLAHDQHTVFASFDQRDEDPVTPCR